MILVRLSYLVAIYLLFDTEHHGNNHSRFILIVFRHHALVLAGIGPGFKYCAFTIE